MSFIYKYYKFRIKQLVRELGALGWFYAVLISISCIFLFYLSWITCGTKEHIMYSVPIFMPALLRFYHRRDITFLRELHRLSGILIFTEYIILISPVIIIGVLKDVHELIIGGIALPVLFSVFPIKHTTNHGSGIRIRIVPRDAFEWKAGIRKNRVFLALLFMLSLLLSPYYAVSLVALWLAHVTFITFQQTNEGSDILRTFNPSAAQTLKSKLLKSILLEGLYFLPALLFYAAFHPSQVIIAIAFLILTSISLTATIITKYCYYTPGENGQAASLLQTLHMVSIVIPFLIPLPLIYSLLQYHRARNNLIQYGFND